MYEIAIRNLIYLFMTQPLQWGNAKRTPVNMKFVHQEISTFSDWYCPTEEVVS